MKKIFKNVLSLFIIMLMLVPDISNVGILAFFSDAKQLSDNVSTGRLDVSIDSLRVERHSIAWSDEDGSLNNGMLSVNSSNTFSFNVSNFGERAVSYSVGLKIAWDSELSGDGKLFIYPHDFNDETILDNIKNGIFDGVVISGDNNGATVHSDMLDGMNNSQSNPIVSAKSHKYKLFFYEDSDITANPGLYHNKNILVSITLHATLYGRETGWHTDTEKSFSVKSIIDTAFPTIYEVAMPKVFFVEQASGVNLADFAIAHDNIEGDLTSQIVITSAPEFTPDKSGVYTITYNVTNSLGNAAAPMVLNIIVWDFTKIASGNYHTLALTSHGKIYSWGYNSYGQLGDGTTTYRQTPQLVPSLDNIVDIAAGTLCSYALSADGQAYAWGYNLNGRLGDNTTTSRSTPVKVLQPDGVAFVDIDCGFATAGGVTADGDVYTWGYGGYGAAGTGAVADVRSPTKINVSNVETLSLGYYNGAAVTKDGSVYTWGDNLHGQLGKATTGGTTAPPAIVPYFTNQNIFVKSISVGWYHMVAVSDSGQLYTCGYGAEGRLGNGSETDRNVPQAIALGYSVKKALAGYYHTGILTTDGAVLFAGQNAYGKHGSNNTANHTAPNLTNGISNATDISLALDSSFILVDNKNVYGMGYGGTGVLGTGNNNNSTVPVKWLFTPPAP